MKIIEVATYKDSEEVNFYDADIEFINVGEFVRNLLSKPDINSACIWGFDENHPDEVEIRELEFVPENAASILTTSINDMIRTNS